MEKLKKLKDELGGGVKSEKIAPDMPFGEWMDHWYSTTLSLKFKALPRAPMRYGSTTTSFPTLVTSR